jgi:hypothetical protein
MPYGSVRLVPGINVERTPTLLEAGYSQSQLIRFRDGLAQKYGGFSKLFAFQIPGLMRDLHAWQDLNNIARLAVGTTTKLEEIASSANVDITPQTLKSDFSPNFSTTSGLATVGITDSNISNVTVFDQVLFNTPIAIGGLILSGLYQITKITGTHSYEITASKNATSTVSNAGAVPAFTTTSGSSTVSVALTAHGLVVGSIVVFPIATTGNGVTISGAYTVTAVADANNFSIIVSAQATASSSFNMNSGNAELIYYINLGPPSSGTGFGLSAGGFGGGGFGGTGGTGAQTGTQISATDWTTDNWGQILLACPANGGIYAWDPTGGFTNASLVGTAPPFNGGIFVSNSQQILIAWASTVTKDIGIQQDPLQVRWSASGDYTVWIPTSQNQAGGFRIPIGSRIVGGMAVANQNLIWTDLDLWAMNYQGLPFIYGFNKIGDGAGLASAHAAQRLRGGVIWMGPGNFFAYNSGGVAVIPCPVWDAVFQNINTAFLKNVRAMPNTPFNEAGWLYPSAASLTGECDSYVKFNITEPGAPWDYGTLQRSAWIDESVLGMPIGATSDGTIYQHETSNDADGSPLLSSFTTGYFEIAEGQDFAFVDQVLPDMKWGTFSGAQTATVLFTFNVVDYPGDTPRTYGPYPVTQQTQRISTNFRGRQMSITAASVDLGSFWRLGRVRYRWAAVGRR